MNTTLQSTARVLAIFACIGAASLAHAQSIDITEPSEPKKLRTLSEKFTNLAEEENIEELDITNIQIVQVTPGPVEQCREFGSILYDSARRRAMFLMSISTEEGLALSSLSKSNIAVDPKLSDLMKQAIEEVYRTEVTSRDTGAVQLFAAHQRDKAELICREELSKPWWQFW